jgi:AcrR family transcriptional regulator
LARTLNPEVHAVRRDAFVDVAQRLIQTKGYQQMSLQDVLNELEASRGAFYHYFDSKAALLEAVLDRMTDAGIAAIAPLVSDPTLPALEKFRRVFSGIASWKNQRRELMLAVLRVWLSDDNAIVREKFRKDTVARMVPLLATIIRQGKDEGTFSVASPEDTARVLWSLMQGAQDLASELWIARQAGSIAFDVVEPTLAAYPAAFERILGIPAGSVRLADDATLRLWFG